MDNLTLRDVLLKALKGYTGKALNGHSTLTADVDQQIFTVVSFGQVPGKRIVDAGLIARLADDKIIIEHDVNDKPLVDALLQAGVPRNQILLAYQNETAEIIG